MKFEIQIILLHLLFGVVSAVFPIITPLIVYALFAVAVIYIFYNNKKSSTIIPFIVVYFATIDVLMRITRSPINIHEFSKYATILLFLIGIYLERKKGERSSTGLIYLFLLIPSVLLVDLSQFEREYRKSFMFNMAGPFTMGFGAYYFSKITLTKQEFKKMMFAMVLPILATLVSISIKMPSLDDISFTASSNDEAVGGFGANQVSTILGYGALIISLNFLFNINTLHNKIFDIVTIGGFLLFAILSFSRGGVVTFVSTIAVVYFFYILKTGNLNTLSALLFRLVIILVIAVFTWVTVDNITGGKITERYEKTLNKKSETLDESLDEDEIRVGFSNREDILATDFQMFYDNPILGVGIAMSKHVRIQYMDSKQPAHTEFSRTAAEHGLFGIIGLFLVYFEILKRFLKTENIANRMIMICFTMFSTLTMLHSASRIGISMFALSLAFITVKFHTEKNNVQI